MLDWSRRLRVLARAALLGVVAGGALVAAFALAGHTPREASTVGFSLAALVFGFGLTAWSATLLLGESLSAAHDNLDRDWSAADTREAMAVLAVAGAAAMAGAVAVTMAIR
jgi:hypothetical protein